jgi:hypothetical protein
LRLHRLFPITTDEVEALELIHPRLAAC